MSRSTMLRWAIFLATVTATWGVLSLGAPLGAEGLEPNTPAPRAFTAQQRDTVVDVEETERQEQLAREAVEPVRQRDLDVEASVTDTAEAVFNDAQQLAVAGEPAEASPPELPTTTTVQPAEGTTTSTEPAEPALITGRVFLDPDQNGVFDPAVGAERSDIGLARVPVQVETYTDSFEVQSDMEGLWSAQITDGAAIITIRGGEPAVPEGWVPSAESASQLVECAAGEECATDDMPVVPNLRPLADVIADLQQEYPALSAETVSYLASAASEDVIRSAYGEATTKIGVLRQHTITQASTEFRELIEPGQELQEVRTRLGTSPIPVFFLGEPDHEGTRAVGEILANFIESNYRVDETETQRLQDEAAAAVEDVTVPYLEDQEIVSEGVPLTQLHIDAIQQTRSAATEEASLGLLSLISMLVGLLGLYLSRFRPEFWARPRMVALLGILVFLAALAVRGTEALQEATTWYVLPAVAFGFMTAILFDQRIAVLMALALGVITAAGTLDSGVTVYASLAAMAPIPFVSSVSTRGAFRNAVVFSSVVAAAIAASSAWFFHAVANDDAGQYVGTSLAWAFGVSVLASLVALAALQFFESAFDITTTLSLLDLTDRNHEALQLIQEKAFGTFNHSLMVGTLADAAARAIGANPLLARAMAYYHDLGKTENPTYFIENQFGIPNPHDTLQPAESAEIIRGHVTDGVRLAEQYNIPSEVTQGIVSHHGDGVMRFFYEKARETYGEDVEVEDYRHIGHKPRTAEAAIIMLADSLEAACRAVFQTQEPSPDAIEKVVDRIVNEKLDDGQLAESPLTLAELTRVRQAFLDALKGHYHQRIQYPNFPGS